MMVIEKLLPEVLKVIPEEERHLLPELFEKIYLCHYDDEHDAFLLSYWRREVPAVAFDVETSKFLGVCTQEWAVENGVLL